MAIDPVPELLRAVWQRSLPLIRERLDHFDQTSAHALAATLTPSDLDLARSNAHKLAGSLGTFGYPTASEAARRIEAHLEAAPTVDGTLLKQETTLLRSILKQ